MDERVDKYEQTGFGSYEFSSGLEMQDPEVAEDIFKMIRISSRMAQDALEERGANESGAAGRNAYTGRTFRGCKLTNDYLAPAESIITIKSMISSSKRIAKAAEYYRKRQREARGGEKAVLVEFILTGKGAVDISGVSKVQGEEEVLIPANTKFKVVKEFREGEVAGEDGIRWDNAQVGSLERRAMRKGEKPLRPMPCNAVQLEEVSGPGSEKREETGEVADMRREIRDNYRLIMERRQRQGQRQRRNWIWRAGQNPAGT